MKKIVLLFLLICSQGLSAQIPEIKWIKTLPFEIISQDVDAEDNIYIAGDFGDTISFGNEILVANGGYWSDILIAKYDSAGNLLWFKQVGGFDSDNVAEIGVDNNNDVYLLSCFNNNTIIEGDTIPTQVNNHRPLLIKYSKNGDYLWSMIPVYNQLGCFHPEKLKVDNDNNVIIMGNTFYGTNVIFPDTTIADSLASYFIAKYKADGAFEWARGFKNSIHQLTLDKSDNVILLKQSDTTYNVTDFIKLSTEGNLLWTRKIDFDVLGYEYNSQRYLPLLDADRDDNIYLATSYSDTLTIGGETYISRGNSDIILIKYDSAGYFDWGISAGGPKSDNPKLVFCKDDKVLMAGQFINKIFFNTDSIIASKYWSNGFIVEYDQDGQNEQIKKVTAKNSARTDLITSYNSLYLSGVIGDSTYFGNYLWVYNINDYNGKCFLARFYNDPPPPEKIIEDFKVYPNPTKEFVNVNFNSAYQNVTLELYNMQGARIKTYSFSTPFNSIDVDFLSNGIYLFKLINDNSAKSIKVVKI